MYRIRQCIEVNTEKKIVTPSIWGYVIIECLGAVNIGVILKD